MRLVELDWYKAAALTNSSFPAKRGIHLEGEGKDHHMGSMLNSTNSVRLPVIINTGAML